MAKKKKPLRKRLVTPGDYLKYGQLWKDRENAADMKFGSAISSNQAQVPRDNAWYDQYRQQILDAQQRQSQNQAATVAQIQGLGQSGVNASQQLTGQQLDQMQADASVRGAQVDPNLKATADNASLIRQALTNSFGAQLANMGQAENQYLGQQGVAAGQAKLQHLGELSAAGRELLRQRGDFLQEYTSQAKSDSHKRALENKAFGLDVKEARQKNKIDRQRLGEEKKKAAFDQAYKQATIDIRRGVDPITGKPIKKGKGKSANERLTEWKLKYAQEHGYLPKTGPGAAGKGAAGGVKMQTSGQQMKFRKDTSHWYTWASQNKGKGEGAVRDAMLGDPKSPGDLGVAVVLDRVYRGYLTARTQRQLRRNGINPKNLGIPLKKPKATGAGGYSKGSGRPD